MLALCGLVLMAILLSSPAARASHWKVSVTDSGGSQTTAVITGIPGFDPGQNVTTPWTPPADGNNSTSFNLGSDVLLTAGDASGSCSATVNAKVTLTWVADPASDPAPTQVWIGETAAASAYAIGTGPTSQASDGLPGDTYVKDPPGYHLDGGSMVTPSGLPGGGRLTKLTVSNGSISFNHALSASSSSGESQSDAVDDQDNAYLSYTLSIHAQPYNFHQVSATDNRDGTLNFTYSWSSTSGNVSDMNSCVVYEHVVYPGTHGTPSNPVPYQPPSPPYNTDWSSANNPNGMKDPTELPSPKWPAQNIGPGYTFGDNNLIVGTFLLPQDNVTPVDAPFTATQTYVFDDSATGETEVQIPGGASGGSGPFSITREVKNNTTPAPPYASPYGYVYTISKNGSTAQKVLTP